MFTSGYLENSIVHGGRLDAGVELLSKPYAHEAIDGMFRHVLANQAQRKGPPKKPERRTQSINNVMHHSEAEKVGRTTILVFEDDGLIRMNTAEMLEDAGLIVVEAESAEKARAALQTMAIDVLVTDVNLPGASGVQLADEARKRHPSTMIVFATGDPASVRDQKHAVFIANPYDARSRASTITGSNDSLPTWKDEPRSVVDATDKE